MREFFKNFIRERWYLHFSVGIIISYLLTRFIDLYMHSEQIPNWFIIFINLLVIGAIAFLWESYFAVKKKAPFSKADILWSDIGAIIGCLLYLYI